MNNIKKQLQTIKNKKIGLMTHVVVGYPSLDATIELVQLMEKSGVAMIELQIPFSDPLADGPTIMKACEQSLKGGTRVEDAFTVVKKLRQSVNIPLFFMCYYNTVFRYPSTSLRTSGVEGFCKGAAEAGISGLIVPDMPLDEEQEEQFYSTAKKYGLPIIFVVSPASTEKRLRLIGKHATCFVYATARQGITGAKDTLGDDIDEYLQRVKKYIPLPLAVGFGISKKEHIESLVGKADIAVVGSKLVDILNTSKDYRKEIGRFLDELNVVE